MSDLDLDAIRAWWSNFDASVEAGIKQLDPALGPMAMHDIHVLLAEVERLRAERDQARARIVAAIRADADHRQLCGAEDEYAEHARRVAAKIERGEFDDLVVSE